MIQGSKNSCGELGDLTASGSHRATLDGSELSVLGTQRGQQSGEEDPDLVCILKDGMYIFLLLAGN